MIANLLNTGLNLFTNASVDSLVNGTIDTGLNLTFNSLFNRTFDKNGTEGAVVETVINLVKVTVSKCGDVLFTKTNSEWKDMNCYNHKSIFAI